jgi:hypothetical protein
VDFSFCFFFQTQTIRELNTCNDVLNSLGISVCERENNSFLHGKNMPAGSGIVKNFTCR